MRSPSRPPESNQLLTFVILFVFGLLLWGIAAFVWWQAYVWFAIVTPPTFILTFLALPIPFLAYRSFTGRPVMPGRIAEPTPLAAATPTSATPTAAERPARASASDADFVNWLGNGDSYRGVMVLMIFLFWSILYWNLPGIFFTALSLATWGLLTILGLIILRMIFRRPGQEVPGATETKSKPK